MKHPDHVPGWNGTLEELAVAVGSMRYHLVADFVGYLAGEMIRQSTADGKRGRVKLAAALFKTSYNLSAARKSLDTVWKICEPYMTNE